MDAWRGHLLDAGPGGDLHALVALWIDGCTVRPHSSDFTLPSALADAPAARWREPRPDAAVARGRGRRTDDQQAGKGTRHPRRAELLGSAGGSERQSTKSSRMAPGISYW